MGKKVAFCTLGCKVSQYETEAMAEAFSARGFTLVSYDESADVYVINTCTVTGESDRKSRQMIRRAKKQNPDALVMVTGCYSQVAPGEVAEVAGVSYVSGSDRKLCLPLRAEELLASRPSSPIIEVSDIELALFEPMCITHAPRTRAYVKIEDGCECRCTYCIIPSARGSVRSKAPEDVLREVRGLAESGVREVVLTGIETASYGLDLGDIRLPELLSLVSRESGIERIRLGSLSPEMMTERTVAQLAEIPRLAPHFHLSMQSGSDSVLHAMRRRYSAERALKSLACLREAIPGVQFTTDMMVGFPGETDEHFAETVAFCREARFLAMHVFAYSRRPGTIAAEMPNQVPEPIKHDRSARLIALARSISGEILDGILSQARPLSVIFETKEGEYWHGHSDEFIECCVLSDEPLAGELRLLRPLSRDGNRLICGLID